MKIDDDSTEEQRLIRRLKGDIEQRERYIGALLDKIHSGPAGSMATVTKAEFVRPWRRVFFDSFGEATRVTVWNERLVEPYRGGEFEQIPSEPKPWDQLPPQPTPTSAGSASSAPTAASTTRGSSSR